MRLLPEQRLADLFVRYWDNSISAAERDELQQCLSTSALAREQFQFFCTQAVCLGEHARVVGLAGQADAGRRPLSRRRALSVLGGGVAASVATGLIGLRYWQREESTSLRLCSTSGDVTARTPSGRLVAVNEYVPARTNVITQGLTSSALLVYPDGTQVSLGGDSMLAVGEQGNNIFIVRGTATAQVPVQADEKRPLTLATSEAVASRLSGAVLTLGRTLNTTEVGVQSGRVSVADVAGEPLEIVHGGEYLTVRADGQRTKKVIEPVPERMAWDLSKPLPEGWHVGVRETSDGGPYLRPVLWFDPHHKIPMFQIRSDKQWSRGHVLLRPESMFQIRYWVERPGPGQFCLCARTDSRGRPDTGMLECNDAFRHAQPRQWQTLRVRAGDMLNNLHAPKFGAPWIAFLFIFNTYAEDLDLKIADVRVV